jgi:DNA-binding response OmpR family regulator
MVEKTKILIVDDEPVNLDFFEVMLGKLGFIVDVAEDGEEALEKVKSFEPHLIILDNVMPKLSGWQVTRTLKGDPQYRDYRSVPIIMFSAMGDAKDKVEGFELGIEDYITKPFNFSEVLARIRSVLRGRKLVEELEKRKEKIERVEQMYSSFVSQIRHMRNDVDTLQNELEAAAAEESSVPASLKNIRERVDSLEETIQEVEKEGLEVDFGDDTLRDLDERMQQHFAAISDDGSLEKEVRE